MSIAEYKLSPYSCARDRVFIDWLVSTNLAQRDQLYEPTELEVKLPKFQGRKVQRLRSELVGNANYIATRDRVSLYVHNRVDEMRMHDISVLGNWLKEQSGFEDLLYHIPGIGWSIGLVGFKLPAVYVPFVYSLWQRFDRFYPLDKHVEVVLGQINKPNRRRLQAQRSTLNTIYFDNTPLIIKTSHYPEPNQIMLAQKELLIPSQEGTKPRELFNPPLGKIFQDSIAHLAPDLFSRGGPELLIKPGAVLTQVEEEIFKILTQNRGYIIPYDYLFWHIYPDAPVYNPRKLASHVSHLREKIVDRKAILTKPNLGIGSGFQELELQNSGFHSLWECREMGILEVLKTIEKLKREAGWRRSQYEQAEIHR